MYYSSSGDSMSEDNDTERHLQHLADRTMLELERAMLKNEYPALSLPLYEEGMTDEAICGTTLGLAAARVLLHDSEMTSGELLLVRAFGLWYRSLALEGKADVVDRMYANASETADAVDGYRNEFKQYHGPGDEAFSRICAAVKVEMGGGEELYFSSMTSEDLVSEMESYLTTVDDSEGRATYTFEGVPRRLWDEIGRRLVG